MIKIRNKIPTNINEIFNYKLKWSHLKKVI